MSIKIGSRCQHVYLHVDRRFFVRDHDRDQGLIPIWKCNLKKKNLEGVCGELFKAGIETSCHPEECPLASKHMPWDQCPFYVPKPRN
ncbi:hypothetical protein JXM67_04870 [candidate division WOR-3 bacterium]|nr:hypothetical protein [candidate division WOR-3 bacterium]